MIRAHIVLNLFLHGRIAGWLLCSEGMCDNSLKYHVAVMMCAGTGQILEADLQEASAP